LIEDATVSSVSIISLNLLLSLVFCSDCGDIWHTSASDLVGVVGSPSKLLEDLAAAWDDMPLNPMPSTQPWELNQELNFPPKLDFDLF
jgi:hypothetical protein